MGPGKPKHPGRHISHIRRQQQFVLRRHAAAKQLRPFHHEQ